MPPDTDTVIETLMTRLRAELSAEFRADRPIRFARAPGRLDVMGGIADYTGSLVCELPLDRSAAIALQERDDRQIQVFSFNLFDEHVPFTFQMPLDALLEAPTEQLRQEFNHPGRKFAAYLIGCLRILHDRGFLRNTGFQPVRTDPHGGDPQIPKKLHGFSFALYSTIPIGAGVSSSAAIEVATMKALIDYFDLAARVDGLQAAAMCQQVENQIVGAPCGIMDQVTSCLGHANKLLVMLCQPHELRPYLTIPPGMRFIGINSNVKHSVSGGQYGRTRCAAFMGHKMILTKMADLGKAASRELTGDPMHGYLANLDPDDYKRYFRPYLPESMLGRDFLAQYGSTIDQATRVEENIDYNVVGATDHHVLEARRVRNFVDFVEEASKLPAGSPEQGLLMDKAGHLMYASHISYTNDALLGAPECDLLVDLIRKREKQGLYGAKITGGGAGGTVAVLCEQNPKADAAIADVMREYEKQTGHKPEAFTGTSSGAMV